MTSLSRSFNVLMRPEPVWQALVDFNRWGAYVLVKDAKSKGWGDRWQPMSEYGPNMKLSLFSGPELMQEWTVDEWNPPKRLALSSKVWHGSPYTKMDSRFVFVLESHSAAETAVTIGFESRFSHPVLGFLLALVPLRGEFEPILKRFEQALVAALPGA